MLHEVDGGGRQARRIAAASGETDTQSVAAKELQKTAAAVIDMLGPKDLAAVVFTGATYRSNQGLTADRNKLTKAWLPTR
jgi:hypothetical protein